MTPNRLNRIRTGYLEGKSTYQLAEETGISQTSIVNWLRAAGVPLRGKHDRRVQRKYIERCAETIALRSAGVPAKEIARRQNVTPFTIWHRLKTAAPNLLGRKGAKKKSPQMILELSSRYTAGETLKQLSLSTEISVRTIRDWLRANGVKMRRRGVRPTKRKDGDN